MKKSIAIDMDQVLANLYKKMTVTFNEITATNMTEQEFIVAPRNLMTPEQEKALFLALNEPDYFRDLELLDPAAIEVLKHLSERYELFIATAAMEVPGCFTAKYDWLREHFPFLNPHNFVFCGTKSVIHTDYLIDDSPNQLRVFTGTGLLYDMPYNRHVEEFVRVGSWREIQAFFDAQ